MNLHLFEDVLYLCNIQQIASIFIGLQKGHHSLSFEGIELVQPVVVQLGLPDEQHNSYFANFLLPLCFECEGEAIQRLRIEYQIVIYLYGCVPISCYFNLDSVVN